MSFSPPGGGFSKLSGDLGPAGTNTRALNTPYINGGKGMLVMISVEDDSGAPGVYEVGGIVNGVVVTYYNHNAWPTAGQVFFVSSLTFFVPPGATYRVDTTDLTGVFQFIRLWWEAT